MSPPSFLVTGGSSGIGAAIAAQLAASGGRVGILSRQPRPLGEHGDGAIGPQEWIRVDLCDDGALRTALASWLSQVPHLDGLVLSAVDYGDGPRHPVTDSSLAEFDRLHAVNLRAQFVLLSILLPALMARPRAFILGVSSLSAVLPAPGRALYAASKAGSLALLRGLADELEGAGVAVIQAAPENQVVTPGLRARRPAGFAFTGYDRPEIFQPLAAHLATTLGDGMNAQILTVDGQGGWTAAAVGADTANAAQVART
jgi:NAD(P)-dependent dehydrogenase (short-subunit alcohol dehydrogenase family)